MEGSAVQNGPIQHMWRIPTHLLRQVLMGMSVSYLRKRYTFQAKIYPIHTPMLSYEEQKYTRMAAKGIRKRILDSLSACSRRGHKAG